MKKIFEGARFGDKFKTRDGRKALYFCRPTPNVAHRLFIEGTLTYTTYNDYGRVWIEERADDIVSEWTESIDEEKLDRLAENALKEEIRIMKHSEALGQCYGISFESGFKKGYRKAKEEL